MVRSEEVRGPGMPVTAGAIIGRFLVKLGMTKGNIKYKLFNANKLFVRHFSFELQN